MANCSYNTCSTRWPTMSVEDAALMLRISAMAAIIADKRAGETQSLLRAGTVLMPASCCRRWHHRSVSC
jgi:hypothetical protein